jgi:hypothetical protein
VLLLSLECRDRGDRLGLTVRKVVPYDSSEGALVGFAPEQWQAPAKNGDAAKARKPDAAAAEARQRPTPVTSRTTAHREPPPIPAATVEAARPGVESPVSAETARLVITIYETEDAAADRALLRAVAAMLGESPGNDEVRLVIHDAEGQDSEFDLPHASVSEELARSIGRVLSASKGRVELVGAPRRAA